LAAVRQSHRRLTKETTKMTGRNLMRRLERLESRLVPTSAPEVINVVFISTADGKVIDQFPLTCDDDRHNRYWQTRSGQQKPAENTG
jgi:hypothetical protein